jgi:hypothetical protein
MSARRALIFGLLGPPIGFVTGFWGLLQLFSWAVDSTSTFDIYQLVLLPEAYIIGIVPALIVAAFDQAIATTRYRILWTTLFAYGAGFLPIVGAIMMGFINSLWVLPIGIVGAVPGAICSWLAGGPRDATRVAKDA